jgi:hypothetical protein
MTKMSRWSLPLRICALLFWPWLLAAAEPARLPYELIYRIQQTEAGLSRNFTNLEMRLRMKSTTPGVAIPDLKVYIDSKGGPIPVALDPASGSFTLPMKDSLVAEEAWVVVNQPKGTMNFEWYVGLKVGDVPTNGVHYRDLMRPLQALEIIRNEMEKVPGSPPLTIYGLRMIFPPEKETSVVVHAKGGDKVFKTGATHALVIPYETSLLLEDPKVSIPVPPIKVDVADPADVKQP